MVMLQCKMTVALKFKLLENFYDESYGFMMNLEEKIIQY